MYDWINPKGPQPEDWRRVHGVLLATIDILRATKHNPSKKQQEHILALIGEQLCQIYDKNLETLESG